MSPAAGGLSQVQPGERVLVSGASGQPLHVRFAASHYLSHAEDHQYDQQKKADQEEYPCHVGQGHA